MRTHGTPQQIVRDPIAISEYLGTGFNDNSFGESPAPPASTAVLDPLVPASATVEFAAPGRSQVPAVHAVLEQEKIQRWIEGLKTPDHQHAAAELVKRPAPALPALIAALERRDVELRSAGAQGLANHRATADQLRPLCAGSATVPADWAAYASNSNARRGKECRGQKYRLRFAFAPNLQNLESLTRLRNASGISGS